jgi:hypothetical protein
VGVLGLLTEAQLEAKSTAFLWLLWCFRTRWIAMPPCWV